MENNSKQSLRLFYALWPDDATREALMQLQVSMLGRKTRPEHFHVTLAFLGQQPADLLPNLKAILAHLPQAPVSLELNRIGHFAKNKIAWVGMHETPIDLATLQRSLLDALLQNKIVLDIPPEFRPHITLARNAPPPDEGPITSFIWHSSQIGLIESINQAEGAVYRTLASLPLTS